MTPFEHILFVWFAGLLAVAIVIVLVLVAEHLLPALFDTLEARDERRRVRATLARTDALFALQFPVHLDAPAVARHGAAAGPVTSGTGPAAPTSTDVAVGSVPHPPVADYDDDIAGRSSEGKGASASAP